MILKLAAKLVTFYQCKLYTLRWTISMKDFFLKLDIAAVFTWMRYSHCSLWDLRWSTLSIVDSLLSVQWWVDCTIDRSHCSLVRRLCKSWKQNNHSESALCHTIVIIAYYWRVHLRKIAASVQVWECIQTEAQAIIGGFYYKLQNPQWLYRPR